MFGFAFAENNKVFKSWQNANPDKEIWNFYPVPLSMTQTDVTEHSMHVGIVIIYKEKPVVQTNA
jgi:hypothetical protein